MSDIIVIPAEASVGTDAEAVEALFAAAIPGVAFTPLSRDEAHQR